MAQTVAETAAFASTFVGALAALDLIAWGITSVARFFLGATLR